MYKYLPILLILSLITCCIEVEISVPGFIDMTNYYMVSSSAVQMTVAFNLIGFCVASVFYGPLSEIFGRRKIMIAGNFIMFIGATLCVLSTSIYLLYLFRLIQGVGAACSAVVAFTMIADVYDNKTSIKIFSVFNTVFTLFMALAPIIGGIINQFIGWKGNYALLASISFVSWLSLYVFLPETNKPSNEYDVDTIISNYLILLKNKTFLCTSLIPSLLYSGYIAFITIAPFLFINTMKVASSTYIINQAIIILAFAITSFFASRIINILKRKKSISISLVFCSSGVLLIALIGLFAPNAHYAFTTLGMSLYSIGFAICYPIIFSESLEIFPKLKGYASSINMSIRTLLMSIIISVTGVLFNGTLASISFVLTIIASIIIILTIILSNVNVTSGNSTVLDR